MNSEFNEKRLFGDLVKQVNSKFERCLWPYDPCSGSAIRAHSIQNSKSLDLLSDNGHVIMPRIGLKIDEGPYFYWESIGKNKATTFTGLCATHDREIFLPIDTIDFLEDDPEQLFLLAYRSVLRELHAKMKAAADTHAMVQKGVEMGRFNPSVLDEPPATAAVMAIAEAYSFYRYKFNFDFLMSTRQFDKLEHQVFLIKDAPPTVGVSSVFSFIDNMKLKRDRDFPKCVCLNAFPTQVGTYVVFSYFKEHAILIRPNISQSFDKNMDHWLYELSKLILMHCENFVISPRHFKSMEEPKKKAIEMFFMANITGRKLNAENPEFYLF